MHLLARFCPEERSFQQVTKHLLRNLHIRQISQLLADLLVNELNLPPIELNGSTKGKTSKEIDKNRENHLAFLKSLLNVGSFFNSKSSNLSDNKQTKSNPPKANQHIHGTSYNLAQQLKSSSRMLAQMDNLRDLMKCLLDGVTSRLTTSNQRKYFLDSQLIALYSIFNHLSIKIEIQMADLKQIKVKDQAQKQSKQTRISRTVSLIELINNVDSIVAKTRTLRLVHLTLSLDQVIKDNAWVYEIELDNRFADLETRVSAFFDATSRSSEQAKIG